MKLDPIRLRFVLRQPVPASESNPRDAFWRAVRRSSEQEADVAESEGKLRREFGPALRALLIQELAEPLRQFDETLYRRELDHYFFRFFDRPRSEKTWEEAQAFDAFARLLEQRQQLFRESVSLRRIQERLAAASSVTFSVRLAGYSSLNLDLSLGSIRGVAEAFDNDFESFRVFLEAFVPQAFARVFYESDAEKVPSFLRCEVPQARHFRASKGLIRPFPKSWSAPKSLPTALCHPPRALQWLLLRPLSALPPARARFRLGPVDSKEVPDMLVQLPP